MTTQLSPAANPVLTVGEIFGEQIEAALVELGGPHSGADGTNIHGARKQLKRARATLRLLRGALGEDAYRLENTCIRDAARPLSAVRDSEVLLDALDGVVGCSADMTAGLPIDRLRDSLKRHRAELRASVIDRKRLAQVRESLQGIERRAQNWKFDEQHGSVLESGLKRTYRQGRKAHQAAQAQPTVENLHEWRKQTKYLWHQLQLLERLSPGFVGELTDEMHALSDYLGDDHDLAVLRARAFELLKAELNETSGSAIKALIDRRRAELRTKALKLGERLYADNPKSFVRRFGSNSRIVTQPSRE